MGALSSDWILLSREGAVLSQPEILRRASRPYGELEGVPLWTDDHINLLKVLKKKER